MELLLTSLVEFLVNITLSLEKSNGSLRTEGLRHFITLLESGRLKHIFDLLDG